MWRPRSWFSRLHNVVMPKQYENLNSLQTSKFNMFQVFGKHIFTCLLELQDRIHSLLPIEIVLNYTHTSQTYFCTGPTVMWLIWIFSSKGWIKQQTTVSTTLLDCSLKRWDWFLGNCQRTGSNHFNHIFYHAICKSPPPPLNSTFCLPLSSFMSITDRYKLTWESVSEEPLMRSTLLPPWLHCLQPKTTAAWCVGG